MVSQRSAVGELRVLNLRTEPRSFDLGLDLHLESLSYVRFGCLP